MLGKLIGTLIILCGFSFGAAVFTGALEGRYLLQLPVLWAGYLALVAFGVTVNSLAASTQESGTGVRRTGIALIFFGGAALATAWLNARGLVEVAEPLQLWLLFATSVIAGVFGIFTSRF
jgi:hypothetical protein